jgi:hypothetical protein
MRFVAVLAISLLGVSTALGQSAPASSAQPPTGSQTASAEAPPAHPITHAQVDEILELTHSKQLAQQSMRAMLNTMRGSFPPFMPQDVMDDLEQQLLKIDFEPMAVAAYQKHISTEDAAQIIAFYKTPAGQRLISVMPEITREMQLSGSQEGERIAQQVIQAHMDEIRAAARQYKEEQTTEQPKVITPN